MAIADRRIFLASLTVIVACAGYARLSEISYMEFKSDEALHHSRVVEMVDAGELPARGWKSSRGNYKPPLFYYLCGPVVWASEDPSHLAAFIAVVNTAAVGLFFLLAWRFFGPIAAVPAAMLFAVSPWAVVYARQIWNPDLMVPFLVLTLFGIGCDLLRGPGQVQAAT